MTGPLGTAQVVHGDARRLTMLADDSVDLVVTSPPYFALRSYQDAGQHYEGQLGSEATPAEFVAALLEVSAECVRVLKPSGSLWVNLGDKYSTYESRPGKAATHEWAQKSQQASRYTLNAPERNGIPYKSLMGIPWRYALACIDQLGLILRAEVIWNKPNGLPESVTDRVRRSHEQWFHFTLQPRYFSAVDEIREPHVGGSTGLAATFARPKPSHDLVPGQGYTQHRTDRESVPAANPLGKLPGSVWTIPTEPLQVPPHLGIDHFAAYPTEWPRRLIQGWTPTGICLECGEGRRPVTHGERPANWKARPPYGAGNHGTGGSTLANPGDGLRVTITGYACACPTPTAHTQPAVVLDPFGGTGTTALVAKALGRHGITVDKSADYCRLAEWRVNDRDQLAKVLHLPRVGPPDTDQMTLFP